MKKADSGSSGAGWPDFSQSKQRASTQSGKGDGIKEGVILSTLVTRTRMLSRRETQRPREGESEERKGMTSGENGHD